MVICWYPISGGRKGLPADQTGKYLKGEWFRDYIERGVTYYYLKKEKPLLRQFQRQVEKGVKGGELRSWLRNQLRERLQLLEEVEIPERLYIDPKKCSKELVKIYSRDRGFIGREWREVFVGEVEQAQLQLPSQLKTPLHSYSRGLGEYLHKLAKGEPRIEEVVATLQNQLANQWGYGFLIGEWSGDRVDPLFLHIWSIKELRQKLERSSLFPKTLLYIPRLNQILGWVQLEG